MHLAYTTPMGLFIFGSFFLIELHPGLFEQFIETFVFPVRIVPFSIARIGRGEHPIDGGASVPVTHDPVFFQPDNIPVFYRL